MKRLFTTIALGLFILSTLSAQCITGNCARGFGVFQYKDGHQYKGEWKANKRHGLGTFIFANGQVQTGTWKEGKLVSGSTTFSDSSQYIGDYQDSKRHGTGTMIYKDGRQEHGIYEHDTLRYGILHYRDGSYYRGDTYGPKPMGLGTMYYKDKTAVTGWWKDKEAVRLDTVGQESASNNDTTTNKSFIGNTYDETYAVIIAVEDYPGSRNDLNHTRDDAELFYKFLASPKGGSVPSRNMVYLYDHEATSSNIIRAMDRLFAKAGAKDRVIFYFSGHGVEGSFVSYDMRNMLSHDRVKAAFKRSRAQHKICIADACYAGSIKIFEEAPEPGKRTTPPDTGKIPFDFSQANSSVPKPSRRVDITTMKSQLKAFDDRSSNIAVLMSSTASETSIESRLLGHGLFTFYLVTGMTGNANLNNDKLVDITELFLFVRENVLEASDYEQSPILFGKFSRYMPISKIE